MMVKFATALPSVAFATSWARLLQLVDAVDAAGGPTAFADVDVINLAAALFDTAQIFVPRRGSVGARASIPRPLPGVNAPPSPNANTPDGASNTQVNINTASMAPQVQYVLQNSGAKMLVLPAKSLQRFPLFDLDWVDLQTVWVVDDGPELGPVDVSFGTHAGLQVLPYPAGSSPMAGADLQPSDVMAILYTSGTTGPPKGVVCAHAQFWAWCMETADILAVSGEDVLFTTLPLFHINALNTVGQAMVQGCQVVISERFSVGRYWAQVNAHEATVLYLLGAMVPMLMSKVDTLQSTR
jgi:DNA uptake protein ComE-like DNA-binding protein